MRLDAHTLAFVPERPLSARTDYFATIARPGFERVTRSELSLTTGTERDLQAPTFALGDALQLRLRSLPEACGEPAGSVRVELSVPAASDDGNAESVELLLYLSRAAGLSAPELRARAPNRSGEVPMFFVVGPEAAAAPLCVALRAVDPKGRVAEYDQELCLDPRGGSPFVAACSAGVAIGGRHEMAGVLAGREVAGDVGGRRGPAARDLAGAQPDARARAGGPRGLAAVRGGRPGLGLVLSLLAAWLLVARTRARRRGRNA